MSDTMKIDQGQEPDYECAAVKDVGFVDPYAIEGVVILRSDDGREFHMRAFSGEVARHITSFLGDDGGGDPDGGGGAGAQLPTVYKMIEDVCEHNGMFLVKVKIYESGKALRANLYFTGKKDLVLRNYRASDAVALAAYYNIPILVRDNLLKDGAEAT